ncbi:MAG: septum formation protein Maf [Rhodobacteraceae bacterium]|nr:septum formation protein Maf [Paracoccaceae bacterium]
MNPAPKSYDLILASASPRRLALLDQIGIIPARVVPADIDETPRKNELPRAMASRLAAAKSEAIAATVDTGVILAADTVVACGRRALPKAETEAEARACLMLLSGRRHKVLGGICVTAVKPDGTRKTWQRLVETAVRFDRIGDTEIAAYIDGGEWRGKAGGYAVQGHAAAFVAAINGSYTNVVGLCVHTTAKLLRAADAFMSS